LTGEITDPRELNIKYPDITLPVDFLINDNMIVRPVSLKEAVKVDVIRKPTIGNPPFNLPLPNDIDGCVLLKVGDKITTDHIMPAGIYLKLRSNIPAYSKVVFECFTEDGKLSFAERAEKVRDNGQHGIIVARDSYGQGSSREHAAICPMFLGIKAVIAISFERIHAANLINFGIIPFTFGVLEDYDLIEEGDVLRISNIREEGLKPFSNISACIEKDGGVKKQIQLKHTLNDEEIEMILAGGRLNI
jgi:aconitate hydratase